MQLWVIIFILNPKHPLFQYGLYRWVRLANQAMANCSSVGAGRDKRVEIVCYCKSPLTGSTVLPVTGTSQLEKERFHCSVMFMKDKDICEADISQFKFVFNNNGQ